MKKDLKVTCFSITKSQYEYLKHLQEKGISKSYIIRTLLDDYIEKSCHAINKTINHTTQEAHKGGLNAK